jgi:S-adenosylmethionine synthetase
MTSFLVRKDFLMSKFRTAESVSPKHPDKLCDRISDAILDAYLAIDPKARVAVETAGGHGELFVLGEVTASGQIEIEPIVKALAGDDINLKVKIVHQSSEIAAGVDSGGAGDQGIMVGYATCETDELLPKEVVLARQLNQRLYKKWPHDGKTQVTLEDGKINAVVASFQNSKTAELEKEVRDWLGQQPHSQAAKVYVNPTGDWHQGGFDADSGLTGRKLVIDNYGPQIPVGGGAFSGKDATKVDRSAAYMARRIAVDYLRRRSAKEVFCYLAYAIGVAEPVEATVVVDGQTELVEGYDLTPAGIIKALDLRRPQFAKTAEYGHFGHSFTWDK